jgi:hypothetical protein
MRSWRNQGWSGRIWRRMGRSGMMALAAILLAGAVIAAVASGTVTRTFAELAAAPPSPLIYGTNMALFDTHDQIVNNAATQQLLTRQHMAVVRMPFRSNLADATELQALRAIKAIGAAPLVIVHGATDGNALADDTHLIGLAQSVFGAGTVYVEFGNEEDLAGVDVTRYTSAWNAVIPHLKALAPSYKYVGPVNFQYNPTYVATFDKNAAPRPDFNSWHEYVCNTGQSDSYCQAHITNWNTHVQLTNSAVQTAIGTTLPFMITEWNLDPQQDPRYGNASFMRQWTTTALQTMAANAANGLFAAMQYCATNNAGFNLIDGSSAPTTEGQVLFQQLAQASGGSPPPTPPPTPPPSTSPTDTSSAPTSTPDPSADPTPASSPLPSASPAAAANVQFSFEDGGTDGWKAHGSQITGLANTTEHAIAGSHALAVNVQNLTSLTYPYVAVDVRTTPASGQQLDLAIYVPPGMGTVLARPFVMDATYRWVGDDRYMRLVPGWNHLTHALPTSFSAPALQLGVQLMAAPGAAPVFGTLAIDAVGWG